MKLRHWLGLLLLLPFTVLALEGDDEFGRSPPRPLNIAQIAQAPDLALTRSTDEFATRILATQQAVREQAPNAPSGTQFLVVYADKGTQFCTKSATSSAQCTLDEGSLKMPAFNGDGADSGMLQTCNQTITGLTPYGSWQLTIVRQGDQVSHNWHYVVEGYTAEYGMVCGYLP